MLVRVGGVEVVKSQQSQVHGGPCCMSVAIVGEEKLNTCDDMLEQTKTKKTEMLGAHKATALGIG